MESSSKSLYKWVACLKVTLHVCNARAIYRLKSVLGVGKVTRSGDFISLRVRNQKGWIKLLVLFDKFPLRTDKYYAVQIVKESLFILSNTKHKLLPLKNEIPEYQRNNSDCIKKLCHESLISLKTKKL